MNTPEQIKSGPRVRLLDAVAAQNRQPDAFEIPTRKARHAAHPGDTVRLGFLHQGQTERMWVRITDRRGNTLRGNLRNSPFLLTGQLNHGQEISFQDRNILAIQTTEL